MRSFYSRHVIPRAKNAYATVSHDYKKPETTFPLPATLTMDLANELREKGRAFTFNFPCCFALHVRVEIGRLCSSLLRDACL